MLFLSWESLGANSSFRSSPQTIRLERNKKWAVQRARQTKRDERSSKTQHRSQQPETRVRFQTPSGASTTESMEIVDAEYLERMILDGVAEREAERTRAEEEKRRTEEETIRRWREERLKSFAEREKHRQEDRGRYVRLS